MEKNIILSAEEIVEMRKKRKQEVEDMKSEYLKDCGEIPKDISMKIEDILKKISDGSFDDYIGEEPDVEDDKVEDEIEIEGIGKKKTTPVSDLFIQIYKNFNVMSQIDNIKELSKRELYLLITLAIDKFSDSDPVAKHNLLPFKDEAMEIYEINDDVNTKNPVLISLIDETGDKYIETDYIVDKRGDQLSEPLTKDEVRDVKINNIMK